MEFSELFKHSNQLVQYSPDGSYTAIALSSKLSILDASSMDEINIYICLEPINEIQWSSDSAYILCALFKRAIVQIWSINNAEWTCKIDEGSAGLQNVTWAPDSRHILTTSTFHLRITIWSLITKSVGYIKYVKAASKFLDFDKGMKYLAVAERRHCKDYISIFLCSNWNLVKHFESDTKDLAGLAWSPQQSLLCVWDSPIAEFKVILYSLDGIILGSYSAYKWSLTIRCVSWSPSGQFIAVGSYDQKVRLLNSLLCQKITEFDHPDILNLPSSAVVYREKVAVPGSSKLLQSTGISSPESFYEIIEKYPIEMPSLSIDPSKANPKHGVYSVTFSCDNKYLCSVNENLPNTCWIFDIAKLELAVVLIQNQPIKCKEVGPTRLVRDEEDLCKIMAEFQRLGVFTDTEEHVEDLVCLATKDVVPDSIKEDVLKARERGTTLVEEFVTTRLIEKSTDFYATLARKKTPSISRMYKVKVKSKGAEKQKDIKADRNLIQRLFVAAQSGRDIDLNAILSHELSKVPRSLASTNGKLHTSDKAQLQKLLVGEVDIFKSLPKSEAKTCLLIDGAALIQAIGKPAKAQTFEDLSVEFCNSVLKRFGPVYSRVDLLFDRYQDLSIKSGTRSKRSVAGKVKPIRRVISSKDVKLPSNFKSFLSLSENKADLAAFLSEAMVEMAEEKLNPTHELVVAGGFEDLLKVWISTDRSTDHLSSNHEEADASLTGCDSVSQFADIGKKTAWKVFMQEGACLRKLGSAKIDDRIIKDVERFVCKLYLKDTPMTSINEVRKEIFLKRSLDALPPTKDALEFHIHRANYQSLVWHQCLEAVQQLPNPTSCGWMIDDESGDLIPKLMSLSPLPNACLSWDPVHTRLAIGTANNNLYIWSTKSCQTVSIPHKVNFQLINISWNSSGKNLILVGKENTCICYLQ
ncbi:WD repeat-containing protein WRAP73 [Nymphon striatum]|nr:WD repeat-containing protein WRAP73 [Nymphon striatum]